MTEDVLIPDPLESRQQSARFYHSDLSALEDTEIADEIHYLRPLLWGLPAGHWARERVQMLEEELPKRQSATRYGAGRQSRPAEGVKL